MRSVFKLGVIALLLGFLASSGFAGTVLSSPTCVTINNSSGWVLTGPNGGACGIITTQKTGDPLLPATWVVPEGSETALDPVGDFTFNKSFASSQNAYVTIMDVTGGISDYILAGNTFSGFAEVFFYSDQVPVLTGYTNAGVFCNETNTGGCVGSITLPFSDGTAVTITGGSDGENGTFDPFQSGQGNLSDVVQFTNPVPEPSTWIMSGLLLVVAGLARRRTS